MAPYRKMIGEKVYLSPMSPEDAAVFTGWLNDPEVTQYLNCSAQVIDEKGEETWLRDNASTHNYSIILKDGDRLIGNVGLIDHSELHKTSEIGVFIGEKEFWGQGLGTEAMALLLGYAFSILDLQSVMLRVFPWNPRGAASYRKLGFRDAGRLRNALRRYGRSWDEMLMDLIREEFMEGPWKEYAPSPPFEEKA